MFDRWKMLFSLCAVTMTACATRPLPSGSAPATPSRVVVYRTVGDRELKAYIFEPGSHAHDAGSAILLFHAGGWSAGLPEWVFDDAKRFAAHGMVAIPIEYRLSNGEVTPIEALSDVCWAFDWARAKADELHIDPHHVAAFGVSAGGQLVASTATIGCPPGVDSSSSKPDAMLLISPVLLVPSWFVSKLNGRGTAHDYSPLEHVQRDMPPVSIVGGEKDSLAPLEDARNFCELAIAQRGRCELTSFPGLGHILTRNLDDQESDESVDHDARNRADEQQLEFLRKLGFVGPKK